VTGWGHWEVYEEIWKITYSIFLDGKKEFLSFGSIDARVV
jgi:hypothetical protein